ncbi:hypothetical protein C8R43DRAFT_1164558, partial [Mycena crocata]
LSLVPASKCPRAFSPSSFPALRTLELTCTNHIPRQFNACNTNHVISFIAAHPSWKLESIMIGCSPTPAVFEALSSHCTHSALTRLEIGRNSYYTNPSFPASAMQPLLAFTHLRVLALTSPSIDFSVEGFMQMALAWPHLESLELTARNLIPKHVLPFSALETLAQHCPRLLRLDIPKQNHHHRFYDALNTGLLENQGWRDRTII